MSGSLDEYHIGGYGEDFPRKTGDATVHDLRAISPLTLTTADPEPAESIATKLEPAAPPSRHTPFNSPPHTKSPLAPAQADLPQIDPSLLEEDADGESDLPTAVQPPQTTYPGPAYTTQPIPQNGDFSLDPSVPSIPWNLQTTLPLTFGPDSQPPSSLSSAPVSAGLGVDGLYHAQGYSQQSSMTDLGSYVGATHGLGSTTAESSESGYDLGGYLPSETGGGSEAGVPPPRAKKSHARKQPAGHIKRARNAFILFRKHITDSHLIPSSVEVKHQNISVVAAKMWREAPQEVRQKFQEEARIEKEEHQRLYPSYRYQPVFRRTDIIRRRVRKDPAEDEKVEAVAEALIKGKAGDALEADIKEQMVTRSEASESEDVDSAIGAGSRGGSRRRRRETGQLSKGAIRAQRSQARAKQMRQNLLGTNLLNISLYNAQHGHTHTSRGPAPIPTHPGQQQYLQHMGGDVGGYDGLGGVMYGGEGTYGDGLYQGGGEMYRLPPIDGYVGGDGGGAMAVGYGGWEGGHPHAQQMRMGGEYGYGNWEGGMMHPGGSDYMQGMNGMEVSLTHPLDQGLAPQAYYPLQQPNEYATPPIDISEYQLAPILEPSHESSRPDSNIYEPPQVAPAPIDTSGWAREGQETPSGHVGFNERLFGGALASAGLPEVGRDEGLSAFDEAVAQASDW